MEHPLGWVLSPRKVFPLFLHRIGLFSISGGIVSPGREMAGYTLLQAAIPRLVFFPWRDHSAWVLASMDRCWDLFKNYFTGLSGFKSCLPPVFLRGLAVFLGMRVAAHILKRMHFFAYRHYDAMILLLRGPGSESWISMLPDGCGC